MMAALRKLSLILAVAAALTFLFLPLLMLILRLGPAAIWERLRTPVAYDALALTISSSLGALGLVLVLGTPLAYLLATANFPGKPLVEVLMQVLIVTPSTVAGVGLLLVFGRYGLLGSWLNSAGITIGFTPAAVVLAQSFVALPFYVQAGRTAFAGVPGTLIQASRTLGASQVRTFFRIILPLAAPGIVSGLVLAWAKALGEFGVTLMVAGNLPGKTQTLPLAVYSALETDLDLAIAISVLLLLAGFVLLLSVKAVEALPHLRRRARAGRRKEVGGRADLPSEEIAA